MQISLTSAHRIRKALEAHIKSHSTSSVVPNVIFSIYNKNTYNNENIALIIEKGHVSYKEQIAASKKLIDVLYGIRTSISLENKKIDIDRLLNEQAHIEALIKFYTSLSQEKVSEDIASIGNKIRHNFTVREESVRSIYNNEGSISASVVSESDLAEIKNTLISLKREQRRILDTISNVNAASNIHISDEDYALIESIGIV